MFEMPYTLRRLFATLLVYCDPKVWNKFEKALSEDYNSSVYTADCIRSKVLNQIGFVLQSMGKQLSDYNFVDINFCTNDIHDEYREINDELRLL